MNTFYSENELKTIGFKKVGKNVLVSKHALFYSPENISLKSHIRIDDFAIISAHNGHCNIGNFVHISAFCYVQASGGCEMKDFSGLSQGCKIYTKSSDFVNELTNSKDLLNAAYKANNYEDIIIYAKKIKSFDAAAVALQISSALSPSINALIERSHFKENILYFKKIIKPNENEKLKHDQYLKTTLKKNFFN